MKLSAARIFVRDIQAARDFYAHQLGLGLAVDGCEHGFCVFSAGPVQLVVEAVGTDAPPEDQSLVGRFTGLSLSVPDAQATYLELRARGVVFTGQPERQFWGGILATLEDSSRNQLQIVQLPENG